MWPTERILGVNGELARTKAEMQAVFDRFSAEVEQVKADASRSDTWKREITDGRATRHSARWVR
jgi:hypothetical protein